MDASFSPRGYDERPRFRFQFSAVACVFVSLVCLSTPSFATAESSSSDRGPSWIPYLDLGFDSSDDESGGTVVNALGPGATGKESFNAAIIRFGVGVLSPNWTPLPGEPRLFIQAGVDARLAGSDRALDVGEIGTIRRNALGEIDRPNRGDAENVSGQGQFVRQEYIGPAWHAAFGVAFSLPAPWDEGRIRLKPLAAYDGERVRIEGRYSFVTEPSMDVFVEHRAAVRKNPRTDHRLGVGGEIELVVVENDRFEVSAYGNVRYMWLLGGRSTEFSDSSGIVRFEWRGSANVIRGGLGLRIGWRGIGR